jgi:hypothetical protein
MRPGSVGSIDKDSGAYTSPSSVDQVQIDVVIATDAADSTKNGYAMVVLAPAVTSKLVTSPAKVTLSAGCFTALAAFDQSNTQVKVKWDMPSPPVGKLRQGIFGWQYFAPNPLPASPTSVTLTATSLSDSTATGTTTVTLQSSEAVTITPSALNVNPSGTVTLTANSPTGLTGYMWLLYPIGLGTITPSPDNSTAVYKAPASTKETIVWVFAYADDKAKGCGVGMVSINLSS